MPAVNGGRKLQICFVVRMLMMLKCSFKSISRHICKIKRLVPATNKLAEWTVCKNSHWANLSEPIQKIQFTVMNQKSQPVYRILEFTAFPPWPFIWGHVLSNLSVFVCHNVLVLLLRSTTVTVGVSVSVTVCEVRGGLRGQGLISLMASCSSLFPRWPQTLATVTPMAAVDLCVALKPPTIRWSTLSYCHLHWP